MIDWCFSLHRIMPFLPLRYRVKKQTKLSTCMSLSPSSYRLEKRKKSINKLEIISRFQKEEPLTRFCNQINDKGKCKKLITGGASLGVEV